MSNIVESINKLRTNLVLALSKTESDSKVLAITYADDKIARGDISVDLAKSLAKIDKKVVVVEADLRKKPISAKHEVKEAGLCEFVLSDSIEKVNVTKLSYDNAIVDFVPAGASDENPADILEKKRVASLIDDLKKEYEYIIVEQPAIDAFTDALILKDYIDGYVLAVEEEATKHKKVSNALWWLDYAEAEILGLVLLEKRAKRNKKEAV